MWSRARRPLRRWLRGAIHFFSYNLILRQRWTRISRAAGFRLSVPPTVFHPGYFITSEYFSRFISGLDLNGKCVADVCTGSGILALAAARAGAVSVVAIDINPIAARSTADNARANSLDGQVKAICSDCLSALAPRPLFDVIVANPPFFPGEPIDLADRAWYAGPNYRDIAALFEQARDRLTPGGCFYLMLSSDSDLKLIDGLIRSAGFNGQVVAERSILFESFPIYELRKTAAE